MSDTEILEFIRETNPNGTQADCDAMRRFMKAFDIDADTPQEAHEKILASMDSIGEELALTSDRFEQAKIMQRRVKFDELK